MKGRVVKRSGSAWTIIYDIPPDESGKRKQKTKAVKGTKRDAERELAKVLHEIHTIGHVEPSKMTVQDLAKEYLDGNAARWEGSTHSGYREKIDNYIIPHLGKIQIEKLTGPQIDKFLSSIQKGGKKNGEGVSPQTASHCRTVLRAMINWGMKKDIIHLRINPVTRSDSVKVPYKEMQILTPEEANRLVDTCAGSIIEMPVALSLYTGMRQGECFGLHWSDVDFDTRTIQVKYSLECVRGKLALKEPKNSHSRRTFEVTSEIIGLLKKHKEVQRLRKLDLGELYVDSGLVCASERGGFMRSSLMSKDLARVLKKSRLRRIRFHDLRHTHISISLASGESVIRVSKRVGHANPSITLNRYSHCIPGDMGAPVQLAGALRRAREQSEN